MSKIVRSDSDVEIDEKYGEVITYEAVGASEFGDELDSM